MSHASNQQYALPFDVLSSNRNEKIINLLAEMELPELTPGSYSLEIICRERLSDEMQRHTVPFRIKQQCSEGHRDQTSMNGQRHPENLTWGKGAARSSSNSRSGRTSRPPRFPDSRSSGIPNNIPVRVEVDSLKPLFV